MSSSSSAASSSASLPSLRSRAITLTSLSSPDAFDAYVCNGCKRRMTVNDFSKGELKQAYEHRRCRTCFVRVRTILLTEEEILQRKKEEEELRQPVREGYGTNNEFGVSKEMEESFKRDIQRILGEEGLVPVEAPTVPVVSSSSSSSSSASVAAAVASSCSSSAVRHRNTPSTHVPLFSALSAHTKAPRTPLQESIANGLFRKTLHHIQNDSRFIHVPDPRTGRNPLHDTLLGTRFGTEAQYHIVAELLEAGLDPNAGTLLGRERPLHFAVQLDNRRIVTLLLNYGALPNLSNRLGRTPLYYVKSIDIARLLLQEGAIEEGKDKYGMTLCDYADDIKNKPMARFWNRRIQRRYHRQETQRKLTELTEEEKRELERNRSMNNRRREEVKLQQRIAAAGKAYREWKGCTGGGNEGGKSTDGGTDDGEGEDEGDTE